MRDVLTSSCDREPRRRGIVKKEDAQRSMHLKRLELHGFKTFATRTTLDFEGGVTAVVGPNGSGKSNLADALRWALGEQSMRNVRGRKAEDLIFAGTAASGAGAARTTTRPPMGMAEVLVTFDNDAGWLPVDFAEVRIGRRVYRTGENEYLMNGAQVRLRDITDLLARAAINTSGHLIIGQGLVDSVLGARPEDRRALVETLAGLRFYYNRRDDAESKLRAAETNLRSVDAMLAEGAPHIALLHRQAVAYEGYHAVERDLRDLLLIHYAHAHTSATARQTRADADLAAAQQRLSALLAAVSTAEEELTTARIQAGELSNQAGELRGELREAHAAREAAERERAVGAARQEAATARAEELRQALPGLEARHAEAQHERERADEAARAAVAEGTRLREARRELEAGVQTATAAAQAADRAARALADRRRALESTLMGARAELAALGREEESALATERRHQTDQQATARGLSEAGVALVQARDRLDKTMEAVETARAAESRARLHAADATERARVAATERRAAERQMQELQARAGGLRAWLRAAGGGSARDAAQPATVMVAALLNTPSHLATAIAAALGPALAAQIPPADLGVDTADTILVGGARGLLLAGDRRLTTARQQELVTRLAAAGVTTEAITGWGDALARVQPSPPIPLPTAGEGSRTPSPPTPLPTPGEGSRTPSPLAPLSAAAQPSPPTHADWSLGSAEPTAQPALPTPGEGSEGVDGAGETVRAVLSRVLVVRDLPALWAVQAALHGPRQDASGRDADGNGAIGVTLATLAGETLLPSGLLYRPGGDGAAALEKARELRAVEAEATEAGHALSEAVTAADATERRRQERATTAEEAARALRTAEHERSTRRTEVGQAERREAQVRREAEWAAEQARKAAEAAATRARRRAELERRGSEAEQALAVLAAEETPAATAAEEARAALQTATVRRAEHNAAVSLAAARASDAARRQQAASEALSRLADEARGRRADLQRLEREAVALAERAAASTAALSKAAARVRQTHERLRPLEAELSALGERAAALERRVAATRRDELDASGAREAAALAAQRAAHEVENVLAGLRGDLALDPVDLPPPAEPPSGLAGRIKGLRGRLATAGPVNARAPEDLAAATERQAFLEAQSADLRAGIARLRAVIAEANATVRDRFGGVAAELDAQFRVYLKRLFEGGRGELTPTYDEAGLPLGLEIMVQPPGKRTRDLALLSGGERALVGLALIFAMLAVRPIPFCVLDEAEAALDEANTLRVGEILRELSARTQFIVITHNRGAMSHADALYGVTMAESGISQVAGIRLEDVEIVRRSRAG